MLFTLDRVLQPNRTSLDFVKETVGQIDGLVPATKTLYFLREVMQSEPKHDIYLILAKRIMCLNLTRAQQHYDKRKLK